MLFLLLVLVFGLIGLVLGFGATFFVWGNKKWAWIVGGIAAGVGGLVLPAIIRYIATIFTSYWLYQSMGMAEVFLKRLGISWLLFSIGFAIALVFLLVNVIVAAVIIPEKLEWYWRKLAGGLVILFSLIFGLFASSNWDEILLFLNQVPFGKTDPLFGRDISWYVFSYPFLLRLVGWGFGLLFLGGVVTAAIYAGQAYSYRSAAEKRRSSYYNYDRRGRRIEKRPEEEDEGEDKEALVYKTMIRHLGFLASLLCLFLAGYWVLRRAALPLDSSSILGYAGKKINGAGWVDHHYVSGVLGFLPWFSVAIAIVCLIAAFKHNWKILAGAIGAKVTYIVVIWWVGTLLVWLLGVKPTELTKEEQYIRWSNQATLEAFNLGPEQLSVQPFPAKGLTAKEIDEALAEIFSNLRLLDPFQVFLRNVDQDEELRSYYDFRDPDIDFYRYPDGRLVQVMTSARELPEKEIPNRTWVNDHLVFTNGRAVAMARVNSFTPEGNMVYLVKGIPGTGPFVSKEEAIYYGESCTQWIATGTTEKEVGPPTSTGGWEEMEYQGEGGVLLGTGLRRLTFALRFNDFTLLITDRVRPETRIHFLRNIKERIAEIAPFIWQEEDPFIIVGKEYLSWMVDGATWAGNYPYADTYVVNPEKLSAKKIRYLRPPLKITINAYSGVPEFYEVNPNDPVLQTWKRIFPSLFKPLDKMPDELKDHIRYPEQVFIIQAKMLRRHHMVDPTTLYNSEDLWEIAKEHSTEKIEETAPRYVLTVLPGEDQIEYILDWSFTRTNKENGVAFLAARSRVDHYGEIVLYTYPVGFMIMGPAQVENLIDQDPTLGPQLTLLSQQGKEIVRGNLMVLPLKESILYVKPIYVRATTKGGGEGLPQLRFVVIGSVERRIAYGKTLDEALKAFVQEAKAPPKEQPVEVGDCEELWQRLESALKAHDSPEAARVAVELLAKDCQ